MLLIGNMICLFVGVAISTPVDFEGTYQIMIKGNDNKCFFARQRRMRSNV